MTEPITLCELELPKEYKPEAMILHELDMIDSRIYQFEQVIFLL